MIGGQAIDLLLNAIVGDRLRLEIPLVRIGDPGQRPFDIPGTGVMALDQVAVIGVHDPDEIGQVTRGLRMEAHAELRRPRGEVGDEIGDPRRERFETRGLDTGWRLGNFWHFGRSFRAEGSATHIPAMSIM